mgnify:CR=1 FL=1
MLQSIEIKEIHFRKIANRIFHIISSENKEIAKRLMKEVDVGATFFHGNGAYSGRDYEVLMVVMRAKLLPQARDVVKQVDDGAFMIVTNATSVFGEGFKEYDSEEV